MNRLIKEVGFGGCHCLRCPEFVFVVLRFMFRRDFLLSSLEIITSCLKRRVPKPLVKNSDVEI